MTTTRLARAGRSRFFIVLGILVLMVCFIALFNNSQQQLEESNMLRLRCEQQHDALNARLQAIVDHKFRLEKSLENERKDHLETKQNFELKVKEEKSTHSKQVLDASVRLESSQQHYKILQSKHNDLVENCAKTKHTQSEQINGLGGKINSLQNQLQLIKTKLEKELEEWKVKYQNIVNDKNRLEILLKSSEKSKDCSQIERILTAYKANCNFKPEFSSLGVSVQQQQPPKEQKSFVIEKSFKEQQLVSKDLYKIPISITNKTLSPMTTNNLVDGNVNIDKSSKVNSTNNQKTNDSINNNNKNNINNKRSLGSIINSVENFQIAPKPIMNSDDQTPSNNNNNNEGFQQPPPLNPPNFKLSTSTKASHDEINKRALPIASIISPTPENPKINNKNLINTTTTTAATYNRLEHAAAKPKQFPKGVAPIPENFDDLLKNDEANHSDNGNHDNDNDRNHLDIGENKNSGNNNRYANVVNEFSNNIIDNNKKDIKNDFNNIADGVDNLEVKDHLQEVLDNLNNPVGEDELNNNNFFDTKLNNQNNLFKNNQNNDMDDGNVEDVEVIGPPDNDNIISHNNKNYKKDKNIENNNKLINEIVGDQGKEQAFPDGMHLEEPNEEDEDEDDYSNPAARKQEGAAIRN